MAQKLRLLLLIPHLGGGGAEQVTARLARGLSREKYELHLCLITQEPGSAETMPPWVTVHSLGASRVRTAALALLCLIRRLKPDLILSGRSHLNFLVLLLHPFFPRKTRVVVRQTATVSSVLAFGGAPWYTRLFYRFLYPRADRIICQSRSIAEDLSREVGVGKEKIAVLPNPVDIDRIRVARKPIPQHGQLPGQWIGNGPHLLAVGRLAPEKGFDLLLNAFAAVRDRYPQADLIVVGSGPEESQLKILSRTLGIEAAVCFPGRIEHPYQLYPQTSLFVLSSRHEGLPNAVLEALAGDLPIVATPASGGVVDLLRGRPGTWLTNEASSQALAATLLDVLSELCPGQRFHRSLRSVS